MLERLAYRVKVKLKSLLTGSRPSDDFDWDHYTTHYKGELRQISKTHTEIIEPGDCVLENGELRVRAGILPLHPNHRLLYETVLRLKPTSVMEFGCGGGDHLHNLLVLDPDLEVWGLDRSEGQLKLLRQRHPGLRANVACRDITGPLDGLPKCDISYAQAVLMHLQTGDSHVTALANMFAQADQHVVLVENWTKHAFLDDILSLRAEGRIPWDGLHLYYRADREPGQEASLMIASRIPLPDYPGLTRYDLLPMPS